MPNFNRERFLLRCVAFILFVQFAVWGVFSVSCVVVFLYKATIVRDNSPVCEKIGIGFQNATESSLSVLLALLGGGALAADELKRTRKGRDDQPPNDQP